MRIDKLLHVAHPELSELQHDSIDRPLQENMGALSPRAKVLSSDEIVRPNTSMNAAFAKFFAGLLNVPMVFALYVAAGYGEVASARLQPIRTFTTTSGCSSKMTIADSMSKRVKLARNIG